MIKKEIHLNINKLHTDVRAIRDVRNHNNEDMEIQLKWDTAGNVQHTVRVIANGPNLWVKGYYDQGGAFISFATGGGGDVLNYGENDTGCRLTLETITEVLGALEAVPAPTNFRSGSGNARTAYVMCVFLASEMVRNELLEKVLLLGTRRAADAKMWRDYILVYKNWATVSKILYNIESGDNYPTIYAADAKSMFSRLAAARGRGDLTERELDIYQELIENPQIA